jgi:hypothetical protein
MRVWREVSVQTKIIIVRMIFTALIFLSAIVVAVGAGPAEKKFSLNRYSTS